GKRARSVHRDAGRHVRHDDSEAADPKEARGIAGLHHSPRWGLLLPAEHPRAPLPRERSSSRPRTVMEAPMTDVTKRARTYNQVHVPRKYTAGKPRVSVYWSWSYPWESNRDVTELDNRYSTMTEVRRVLWPAYESVEFSERMFLQGIAGTLE